MKQCPRCQEVKSYEFYYTSKTHRDGYASWCKGCESERNKAKTQKYRDSRLAKAKEWRDSNKDKQNLAIKNWRLANQNRYEAILKEWAKNNKAKINAKWMKREAGKKHRTPSWLTEEHWLAISCKYSVAAMLNKNSVERWDVDHIIPLQGKTVSGLHVPWNLQVITAKQNKIKGNRI